jgi:hypothetical protein
VRSVYSSIEHMEAAYRSVWPLYGLRENRELILSAMLAAPTLYALFILIFRAMYGPSSTASSS